MGGRACFSSQSKDTCIKAGKPGQEAYGAADGMDATVMKQRGMHDGALVSFILFHLRANPMEWIFHTVESFLKHQVILVEVFP